MDAMRALKRRLSDVVYKQMVNDANHARRGPGGHLGATLQSSAAGPIPTAALRTSHFPDPPNTTIEHPSRSPRDTEGAMVG
jgi:hypothetical protein